MPVPVHLIVDQNFPRRVAQSLQRHTVRTAYEMGWATLTNGDLLAAAEAAGFDAMITADRHIRYQQDLSFRRIALVVVTSNNRSALLEHLALIQDAVDQVGFGGYVEVDIPRLPLIRRPWPNPRN